MSPSGLTREEVLEIGEGPDIASIQLIGKIGSNNLLEILLERNFWINKHYISDFPPRLDARLADLATWIYVSEGETYLQGLVYCWREYVIPVPNFIHINLNGHDRYAIDLGVIGNKKFSIGVCDT